MDNLSVAVSGPVPPNPAELIESARMTEFMNRMKKEYDFMVIDTPPIAIVTDALLLKDLVDIHVFVIRHGYSSKQVLQLVEDLYTKRGLKNMTLLVNDVQTKGIMAIPTGMVMAMATVMVTAMVMNTVIMMRKLHRCAQNPEKAQEDY